MVRVRIKSDAPLFSAEDYSYIMRCRDIKPRYKILKELLDKYKTSSKRIYQIWRGEEANRVLWDQPIPNSCVSGVTTETPGYTHNTQSAQVQSSISRHGEFTSGNNSSSIDDTIYSEVLLDKSAETTRPKMSQRLEAQLPQNSTSSRAVKKSVSSNRDKVTLQSNHISRRKNDLEKLMNDTERLAPMLPSLSR